MTRVRPNCRALIQLTIRAGLAMCSCLCLACGSERASNVDDAHRLNPNHCLPDASVHSPGETNQIVGDAGIGLLELEVGPDDSFAQAACRLVGTETTAVMAVADESMAGQLLVTPQSDSALFIRLPDSGVGYLTLEVPEWSITIASSLPSGFSLEIIDEDCTVERIQAVSWNGSCREIGLTEQRHLFHTWGAFTVRISGAPDASVQLSFIRVD